MEDPKLETAIERRALVGQQVGISVEGMIQMLNAGMSVEALLDLIDLRLRVFRAKTSSSHWVM